MTQEAPEIQTKQKAIQKAKQEATQEANVEASTEEGDAPEGKRTAAAVFTEQQEIKLLDFLKDNKILSNKCLMDFKDTVEAQEALWNGFCAEN